MKNKGNLKILVSVFTIILIFLIAGFYFGQDIIFNKLSETNSSENLNENTLVNVKNEFVNTVANEDDISSDIFEAYYDEAENLLNTMTLEEKVGQMFLVRYPESGVINEIINYSPGGYILFSRDFENETKESILDELTECQNSSKIKMIFGVDEEGGTVVRVSSHKAFRDSKFKSPQEIWKEGQLPAILEDSKEKSFLLKSIGLNMNLTPVADVPTDTSSFIYKRSYGRGTEKTAIYVSELIKRMNEDNMISVMKHFPGYGDNVDTHTGIAIDERPYSTFENNDFLPFESGIEADVPAILVNYNIVNCMDSNLPASLSKNVHDILRNELEFTGIIMTDDLAMDAVKSYVENGEAAVQAVLAGNDMIITSDFETHREEVLDAIETGEISEDIINTAVKRILACKCAYNII